MRHSRVETSRSDVVDLSVEKDDVPVDRISVDSLLLCDVNGIEVVEVLVDMQFL